MLGKIKHIPRHSLGNGETTKERRRNYQWDYFFPEKCPYTLFICRKQSAHLQSTGFRSFICPMKVIMYTDGSSLGNPGPGGYGVVLSLGKYKKEISAGYRKTTNNRMELLAVIVGLEALKKANMEVEIYTDSQYVQRTVSEGWVFNWEKKNFKGKKNADLWRRFLQIYRKHRVIFRWVKGHAGIPGNERCDELAVDAARGPALGVDQGYEAVEGPELL